MDKQKQYLKSFIKPTDLKVRSGKGVYINADYHNSINRIISIIGNNDITITDYLENVLAHHFKCFEPVIIDIFNEKYKPFSKHK